MRSWRSPRLRNNLSQIAVSGQGRLGSQGRLPGLLIGFIGAILRAPAMAGDLPAYRGRICLDDEGAAPEPSE